MCESTVIAGGATMATGFINRYQQGERYKQAEAASREATAKNQLALNDRIVEERVAAARRADAASMEADAIQGQVATSAAAGGVQGPSIQELSAEVISRDVANQMAIKTSLGWTEQQIRRQQEGLGEQHVARSLQFMPTSTYLGAAIGGLGVGTSMYFRNQAAEVKEGT